MVATGDILRLAERDDDVDQYWQAFSGVVAVAAWQMLPQVRNLVRCYEDPELAVVQEGYFAAQAGMLAGQLWSMRACLVREGVVRSEGLVADAGGLAHSGARKTPCASGLAAADGRLDYGGRGGT